MSDADFGAEVYQTKVMRTKVQPFPVWRVCNECKARGGHEATCSQVSVESISALLEVSRRAEQKVRDQAARWLEALHGATGKIAILKHENNKLRANGRKLQDRLDKAEAALIAIRDSKYCEYTDYDMYGIGVTDGHRHCARVARDALDKGGV